MQLYRMYRNIDLAIHGYKVKVCQASFYRSLLDSDLFVCVYSRFCHSFIHVCAHQLLFDEQQLHKGFSKNLSGYRSCKKNNNILLPYLGPYKSLINDKGAYCFKPEITFCCNSKVKCEMFLCKKKKKKKENVCNY